MPSAQKFIEKLHACMQTNAIEKTFAKGEVIIAEGDIERNVYFIESGAVRVYLLTDLEELTIRFGYKDSIINSLASFLTEKPSEFYIEAIRKSVIKIISKKDFTSLVYQSEESMQDYIALLELLTVQQIEREVDILTVSPTERLNRVLQRSPNLFQEIPLKYIASYLRMTPETLSRIRNS